LSSSKIISEAHLATSVPDKFIENPTSDFIRAGASFVPSPVTATTSFDYFSPLTSKCLSEGEDLAKTLKYFFISLNFFIFLIRLSSSTSFFSID
jgi:hypothetical protein